MPHADDPIHQLLRWEQDARRLVDEAKAQAKTVQDEANQRRQDRLAQAQQEAKLSAEQRRRQLLDETEPLCQATREHAQRRAADIQKAAAAHLDEAANAALRWLLFEETEHVCRRTIR